MTKVNIILRHNEITLIHSFSSEYGSYIYTTITFGDIIQELQKIISGNYNEIDKKEFAEVTL